MIRWLVAAIGFCIAATPVRAADPTEIRIGYLARAGSQAEISLLDLPAENDGIAGARLAINDNNTTGKFLNQRFSLEDVRLKDKDDAAKAATALAARNALHHRRSAGGRAAQGRRCARDRGTLFFNAGAIDDRLREEDCRANVIHTAPTRSMLADGLAQYLVWKQWRRWFLVVGSHARGQAFCRRAAPRRRRASARRSSRSASSRTPAARAGPTAASCRSSARCRCSRRGAPAYDVLVAADESEVFAAYLPYRTWDPRPVAGSAGLIPTSWDACARSMGRGPDAEPVHEADSRGA